MSAMATRVRQVKTVEKVMLGIRACAVEKLQQLNNEFVDHSDWLKQTISDTREHKDALGLVCPRTTRKAKKGGIMSKATDNNDDTENVGNSGVPRTTRKATRRGKGPLSEVQAEVPTPASNDDMDVFAPDDLGGAEPASKVSKTAAGRRGKAKKGDKDYEQQEDQEPESETKEEKVEAPKAAKGAEKKVKREVPEEVNHTDTLKQLKVPELKAELQKRSLPTSGTKSDLIVRLNAAMVSEDFRNDPRRGHLMVGKDVEPQLGMRVVHSSGPDHGSSKGMYGIIEYIPGRGGAPNEKSVSVRWMSDLSDVRGPYYTGETCDRGSGIGSAKFDLICMDHVERNIFPAQEQQAVIIQGLQVCGGVLADLAEPPNMLHLMSNTARIYH